MIWHQYRERRVPHRALVWLLARVSAHVHHQHVLGFEGPQLPGAASPVAHELLPLTMDMLAVDVLREKKDKRLSKVRDAMQIPKIPFRSQSIILSSASWGVGVGKRHAHISGLLAC